MASLLTALPAASKHTPRIPVNLSVRAGHGTPATLTAPANQKSRPPDTANTEKHVTTLSRASLGTHTTAALVGAAVAHLQPTQQQRKHANRVRNGLTAGLGAADGTHRVDRPRDHQHQPSPSPDARGTCPTCRSRNNARALPHAPATTQTQQKKHPSPPAPKPLARAARRRPQQPANFEAAKAAGRSAAAPCHHPNTPAAARLVAQLLTENAALLLAATRAPENRPICRSPSLRKAPTKVRLETRQTGPPLRASPPPTERIRSGL